MKPLVIKYNCAVHDLEALGHFFTVTGKLLKKKNVEVTAIKIGYEEKHLMGWTNEVYVWWKKKK